MTSHDDLRADFNRAAELVRQLTVVLDRLEHRLDDDDPMLYDRGDDEEPTAPSARPHDGWHLTGRNQRPNNSPTGFARPGVQLLGGSAAMPIANVPQRWCLDCEARAVEHCFVVNHEVVKEPTPQEALAMADRGTADALGLAARALRGGVR